MKPAGYYSSLMRPWAGFISGGVGWFLSHQLGGDSSFSNCPGTSPFVELLIGLLGLAIALGGAWFAWPLWRGQGSAVTEEMPAPRFLALVGLLAAALFAIAIVLQTSAGLIIPRCHA